jgi:hypothetical protein
MVEAVEDIDGGLADTAGGEQVISHMVAEEQHELLSIERGNRFKAAVGGPDSSAGPTKYLPQNGRQTGGENTSRKHGLLIRWNPIFSNHHTDPSGNIVDTKMK